MLSKKGKLIMFILAFSLLAGSTGFNIETTAASTGTYHVKTIDASGKLTTVGEAYTDFNLAKTAMNKVDGTNVVLTSTGSKSPLQIVAMKSGYAQSYPYRTGTGFGVRDAKVTLDIYNNTSASTRTSYVAGHYKMFYRETVLSDSGVLIAKVTLQGVTGYVDLAKTDLIPMVFVDSPNTIKLGGSENYYSPAEQSQDVLVTHDFYTVSRDSTYGNEITVNYSRTYNITDRNSKNFGKSPSYATTYGQAPKWLKPDVRYYSADGIYFYENPELTVKVMDGSNHGQYFAYYQWLPVRSMSNFTATDFNNRLKTLNKTDSVIFNNEQAFIESGNKYGMNPLLLFAQAALESDYGTSSYAKNRYNLFGWNAVDSNPDLASKYDGVFIAVDKQMSRQLSGYFDQHDWRHEGLGFGNKASGVTVRYASDPYYGVKIASIAYYTDRQFGFKDHNAYNLVRLDNDDNTGLTLRKGPGTNTGVWGTTKGSIVHDIRTNLNVEKGFIKTNLPMVVINGALSTSVGPVDLTKEFGYLSEKYVFKLPKNGNGSGSIPTERVIVFDEVPKQLYQVTENLNLRNSWTTNGSIILSTIPAGSIVEGHKTSNGWVKVIYNKQAGYVHEDYLENGSGTPVVPDKPIVPDKPENKILGDLNGDGVINISDMMIIQRHILGVKMLDGDAFKNADLNGDGTLNISDMMIIQRDILGIKKLN